MARRYNLRNVDDVKEAIRTVPVKDDFDKAYSDEENLSIVDIITESEQSESSISGDSQDEAEVLQSKRSKTDKTTDTKTGQKGTIIFVGKDGHRWFSTPCKKIMNRGNSIISPGPVGEARNVQKPFESWSLLLNNDILSVIVKHTNTEMQIYCDEHELDRRNTHKDLDLIELKAFIALLYMSGLQKANGTNLDDLWSDDFGIPIYRTTMPLPRFRFIYKCLRFDDKTTRAARRQEDKFAPIREIWQLFVTRCTQLYSPTSYCTIDEQLVSFEGQCPFKVYNDSKPGKYGIEIVMMNDAETFYMYTAIPYVGKVNTEHSESVPSYYIKKLSEPIHNTARNITCNSWFTSVPIFDQMLEEHNITMVGTLRKNQREIPADFKKCGERAPLTFKYAFDSTKTLLSFTPRQNEVVLVLSTFHRKEETDPLTNKPEIIAFYNSTKDATNIFDQLCHAYTTSRKTRRWPLRMFFCILDQCGVNAAVLYNFNAAHKPMIRRDFIKSLVRDLVKPHLERRRQIPTLRRSIVLSIQQILGLTDTVHTEKEPGKKVRCRFCPRSLDRKTRIVCSNCKAAVCEDHRSILCDECRIDS